jgi:hypothetical protein
MQNMTHVYACINVPHNRANARTPLTDLTTRMTTTLPGASHVYRKPRSPGRSPLRPGPARRAHPLPKPGYRVCHPNHVCASKKRNACMSQTRSLHTRKFRKRCVAISIFKCFILHKYRIAATAMQLGSSRPVYDIY